MVIFAEHKKFKVILATLIVGLLGFMFIGTPNSEDVRYIKEIWQSGHFVLFFLIALAIPHAFPKFSRSQLIVFTIIFCFLFGLATELLQVLVGRDFDLGDLLNDMLGAISGLLFSSYFYSKTTWHKNIYITLSVFFLLAGTRGLIFSVYEHVKMQQEFPVLSSFENKMQLSRWDHVYTSLSLSNEYQLDGEYSMKVKFKPADYSGIFLYYFPRDWSNYQYLEFSIYNPSKESYNLLFRVHDREHTRRGYKYADRFNKDLAIKPGWNHIKQPLNEVFNSLKERKMNSENIAALGLFAADVNEVFYLYVDEVTLN